MIDIKTEKKRHAQRALQLVCTKAVAEMVYKARLHGMQTELILELLLLLKAMAEYEWGEGTKIDDFSKPGFAVVRKGRRSMELKISPESVEGAA